MNSELIIIISIAFVALLAVIYHSQIITEGFANDTKSLLEHFQDVPDQYKPLICRTFRDQIEDLTKIASDDNKRIISELTKYINVLGGC